jgi:hypothetical protein
MNRPSSPPFGGLPPGNDPSGEPSSGALPVSDVFRRLLVGVACLGSASCTGTQVHYLPQPAPPEPPAVSSTLYLVGDGGYASEGRAMVLSHLGEELDRLSASNPERPIVVVYLGDNIYDVGAREEYRQEDLAHLTAQTAPLLEAPGAQGIFLPGNHDWAKGASDELGEEAIEIQDAWLDELAEGRIDAELLPNDGCPGPATLNVGPDLHLVVIDTEALLRAPLDGCGGPARFFQRLRDDLAANADRTVVLTAHHPMASGGPHGGNVGLFEYGPLVYYLSKKAGVSVQDLGSPAYSEMMDGLQLAIAESGTTPLVFAAGHDHSLQVVGLEGPGAPRYQLVSGSASKSEPARRIDGMRYATDAHGYMRLDVGAERARLTVFAVGERGDSIREVFGCLLAPTAAAAECPEAELAR